VNADKDQAYFDEIHDALVRINGAKKGCPRRADPQFALTDCWCWQAYANGSTAPCPPQDPELPKGARGYQADDITSTHMTEAFGPVKQTPCNPEDLIHAPE
jgi:hypothetical protein